MARHLVIGSHSPWHSDTPVGSHRLAQAAARDGWEVLHVDRVRRGRPQRIQPLVTDDSGLSHLPVRSLLPAQRLRSSLGMQLLRLGIVAGSLGRPVDAGGGLVLIDHPDQGWLVGQRSPATVLYRPTDLYQNMRGDARMTTAERWILARSDGVVATSEPVLDHVRRLAPALPHLLLRNGADVDHFAGDLPPRPAAYGNRPVLVYAGRVDDRFDWTAVRLIAEAHPSHDVAIVGPIDQPPNFALPANVLAIGPVAYSDLPAHLRHARAGLLPLSDHPGNLSRSPMKHFEYLAAGLPIVARRTPELTHREGAGLHLYQTPQGAAAAVAQALSDATPAPELVAQARAADWQVRWRELVDFAEAVRRGGAISP